jgi:hypothetical protein
MAAKRRNMTARVVPLRSDAAGDARVKGTVNERLALVTALSLSAWETSGRPLPTYTREKMPVKRTTLRARTDRD